MSQRRRNLEPVPPEFSRRTRQVARGRGVLFSEMARDEVGWLWEGRIPLGNITVLDGDPGLGKSVFTTDLAARVTAGRKFPDGAPCGTGSGGSGVVMLNAEDSFSNTVGPRFDAAGGDSRRAVWLSEIPDEAEPGQVRPVSLPEDAALLEDAIGRVAARLVIVDPLMAFLSGHTNAHKDQDIRHVLARLKSLAQDPDDPDGRRRVLASSKQNLAEPTPSLAFVVANSAANGAARVEWHGGSSLDAVELMRAPLEEEEKSALEEALEFLKDALADGSMAAKQVKLNARAEGISERTLNRAKARLKIRSTREAYGWTWTMLEVTGDQGDRGTDPGNLADGEDGKGRNSACPSQDCQGCQHCQGDEHGDREKGDGNLDGRMDHPLDCECTDCLHGPPMANGTR